jgi:hypothetical protein
VKPRWEYIEALDRASQLARTLNLLLIPWPEIIVATDFRAAPRRFQPRIDVSNVDFGFFDYVPSGHSRWNRARRDKLITILTRAKKKAGLIHGVIFPELAFSNKDIPGLRAVIRKVSPESFLISGIGELSPRKFPGPSRNKAIFAPSFASSKFSLSAGVEQEKHHRWQLDGSQIKTYGLGSVFDGKRKWWENIHVNERTLSFVRLSEWLNLSVLVCEDLARQDPVANLIRSVGPDLVIALLMDGPQKKTRWSARYATVLADDPGSSVLTLTNIGMVKRSKLAGRKTSRVIGLWKDKTSGSREIKLPKPADAAILCLKVIDTTEWTADGRSDEEASSSVELKRIRYV